MKKIIVLTSVTYALKAQEILKDNGIYSKIERSKAVRNLRGCGYGLAFDKHLEEKVYALLSQNSIPTVGSIDEK
ncbi:MAG: DUF3343 domain-containing protein [Clostridia bacterium]|nr:DUF3343 domain-containing protein [Clostridia bacterium]